jgi:hypothetical protein
MAALRCKQPWEYGSPTSGALILSATKRNPVKEQPAALMVPPPLGASQRWIRTECGLQKARMETNGVSTPTRSAARATCVDTGRYTTALCQAPPGPGFNVALMRPTAAKSDCEGPLGRIPLRVEDWQRFVLDNVAQFTAQRVYVSQVRLCPRGPALCTRVGTSRQMSACGISPCPRFLKSHFRPCPKSESLFFARKVVLQAPRAGAGLTHLAQYRPAPSVIL